MKAGDRLLFEGCTLIDSRVYSQELNRNGIEKTITKHWQKFDCQSPRRKVIHSGSYIPVGNGKTPLDIRATIKRITWTPNYGETVYIERPRIVEKDCRALRLF